MKKPRRIFISATGQNDGKTVVCLGLICALRERFARIGFIKPVGQRYVVVGGRKIDEDSVLIEQACQIECSLKDMSPVAIGRGFTRKYILGGKKERLARRIKDSFKSVARGKDLVIIEGTGHAGVGSVFDLSNAAVARMLGSKVIIVSSGGIGRPIDEIMLNAALFQRNKVQIAGVIINKVMPKKYKMVNRIVRAGLKRKGLPVLGVIPYKQLLPEPTVRQVCAELGLHVLAGGQFLERRVDKILVGAMAPHDALRYFSNQSLIITPGDREDMILAVVGYQMERKNQGANISGIILTGGIRPHHSVIELVSKADIPLLLARGDTYKVASAAHDLTVKVRPEDAEKTRMIKNLIEEYVDLEALLDKI